MQICVCKEDVSLITFSISYTCIICTFITYMHVKYNIFMNNQYRMISKHYLSTEWPNNLISHNISLHLITLDIRIERFTEKAFVLERGHVHSGKAPDSIRSHRFLYPEILGVKKHYIIY